MDYKEKLRTFPHIELSRDSMQQAYDWGYVNATKGKYNSFTQIGESKNRTVEEMTYDFFIGKAGEMAAREFAIQHHAYDLGEIDLKIRTESNFDDADFNKNGFKIDVKCIKHYFPSVIAKKNKIDAQMKSGQENVTDFFLFMQYFQPEPDENGKFKLDRKFHFRGFLTFEDVMNKGELVPAGEKFRDKILTFPIYTVKIEHLRTDFKELINALERVEA